METIIFEEHIEEQVVKVEMSYSHNSNLSFGTLPFGKLFISQYVFFCFNNFIFSI